MKRQRKGSVHAILNIASYVAVFLAATSFMLNSVILEPTPIGIIIGPSMVPTLYVGDIVFIQPVAIAEVKIGDIIAFHQPPDEKMVIHRVVRIINQGKIYLRTQGDANDVEDQQVGGWIGVDIRRLIGKIYCLDGQPFRIPLIGRVVIEAKNFSIWLTQNKIWSFWAPMLAILYIFGPYLSPKGLQEFDLRRSLRVSVPARRLFLYSILAMIAISAFTIYFRTEMYTLTMRVVSLQEPRRGYIYYGSMTYGETRNNTLTVSGAPMFPVKTFVWIRGNASLLVKAIPGSARIEPNSLNDLTLQASIPARGMVDPGAYDGMVYIFSDTLLLLLPDEIIFAMLEAVPNPWVAVAFLSVITSFLLASLLASVAVTLNWTFHQILYTLVWRDKLKPVISVFKINLHGFWKKVNGFWQRTGQRAGMIYSVMRQEVALKKVLKFTCIAVLPATLLFLLKDNVLLPIVTLGFALGLLLKSRGNERSELVYGGALANLFFSLIFVGRRAAVFLYSSVNPYWSVVSAGFVGNISFFTTLPITVSVALLSALGLKMARIWYLEQQTSSWRFAKPREITLERTFSIPSLKAFKDQERRLLPIDEIKSVSAHVLSLAAKVREGLAKSRQKLFSVYTILRTECHVLACYVRGKETPVLGIEGWFITFFNCIQSKATHAKGVVVRLVKTTWWMFRLFCYEAVHAVRRAGRW